MHKPSSFQIFFLKNLMINENNPIIILTKIHAVHDICT